MKYDNWTSHKNQDIIVPVHSIFHWQFFAFYQSYSSGLIYCKHDSTLKTLDIDLLDVITEMDSFSTRNVYLFSHFVSEVIEVPFTCPLFYCFIVCFFICLLARL